MSDERPSDALQPAPKKRMGEGQGRREDPEDDGPVSYCWLPRRSILACGLDFAIGPFSSAAFAYRNLLAACRATILALGQLRLMQPVSGVESMCGEAVTHLEQARISKHLLQPFRERHRRMRQLRMPFQGWI